jgi:hypothetical protein
MIIHPTQPLLPKEMMTSSSVSNTASKLLRVRRRSPNSIKATSTQPPHRNTTHIKLRPGAHILKHTIPQAIRTLRIRRISRTIRRSGDLHDNSCPAAVDDLVRPLAVIGSIPVQPGHEKHDGDTVGGGRFLGQTHVDWNVCAIAAGGVRVGNDFFLEHGLPDGGGFEVDVLLALEGGALEGG